ncbi:MAG: selenide, water dikinase SelD [Myxococcota bacterium]
MRHRDLVEVLGGAALSSGGGEVLVSNDFGDDAAVVRPAGAGGDAWVLTADVITPIVDDAETFGQIAAANSISDVYAMGGRPRWALNLAFFPDEDLPLEVLGAVLQGGAQVCERAGVAIVGGHTVRDSEIKYGLSVTGTVDPERVLSNRGGRSGEALVLSKALGTGIVGTAIRAGEASDEEQAAAIESMTTLNADALEVARELDVRACTDVTGFGLLGHLRVLLRGSGLAAEIDMESLPLLPGTWRLAEAGRIPGGTRANLEFLEPDLRRVGKERPLLTLIAADAQTSGGLLLCIRESDSAALVSALRAKGLPAARIGALRSPRSDEGIGSIDLRF